jgi:hypothetical protein
MQPNTSLPPALAAIAAGRDHIRTIEFAKATSKASQTIRKNYCVTGECFGIRPVKVGNHLLWPVAEIAALLRGAVLKPSRVEAFRE